MQSVVEGPVWDGRRIVNFDVPLLMQEDLACEHLFLNLRLRGRPAGMEHLSRNILVLSLHSGQASPAIALNADTALADRPQTIIPIALVMSSHSSQRD